MRPICAVRTAPTELTVKAGLCPRECRDHGRRNRESYPRVFRAPESMGRFAPLNRGVARVTSPAATTGTLAVATGATSSLPRLTRIREGRGAGASGSGPRYAPAHLFPHTRALS